MNGKLVYKRESVNLHTGLWTELYIRDWSYLYIRDLARITECRLDNYFALYEVYKRLYVTICGS